MSKRLLGVTSNLVGLQALGADIEPLRSTGNDGANTLNVRVPPAVRTHVGVRDTLAEAWALAADVTH